MPARAARKTVLMVGIMAAHALGEGCAVGVSFCGERGWAQVGKGLGKGGGCGQATLQPGGQVTQAHAACTFECPAGLSCRPAQLFQGA